MVHPRETITWHYEQDADENGAPLDVSDPRIAHDFTLAVDDYDNIEKTASIVYQRSDSGIGYIDEQGVMYSTCAVNTFIDKDPGADIPDDFCRVGVPDDTQQYEIGFSIEPTMSKYFTFEEIETYSSAETGAHSPTLRVLCSVVQNCGMHWR